jgi:hypothetical protein
VGEWYQAELPRLPPPRAAVGGGGDDAPSPRAATPRELALLVRANCVNAAAALLCCQC